ncbi:MAG: universal stress protein [Verrucomicrobia bacterium]|nr:universal stress protein [Verrucomicrobiota bacterium]
MKNSKKSGKSRRQSAAITTSPNIQTILATTDFSDESRSGVSYAVALGEQLGATIALLHVIEPPSRLSGVESVVLARKDSEVMAFARAKLATLAKHESKGDVAVTSSVRLGKPFHEINTAARESTADVIVIATHGYTGVEHVLLGSTAERVVRHAPCSVLTVPARIGKGPPFRLKKILVPMDFSDLSKGALPLATFLAAQFKAEVVLLHVVEKFPIDYLLGRELTSHTIVPLMKQAEADLARAAADLARSFGIKISAAVREGKPHEEICEAAKALAVDLIVLTTHGYTGLKYVWLGSIAERVVRHAPCPVLVVRATKPRS